MSRNVGASVRARLKNRADARNEDYNLLLTRYGLERLLYRLSVSAYAPNFVLKGALLFLLWNDLPARPTRDIDLLGFGPDYTASVEGIFRDICRLPCDDGMLFDAASVRGSVIRKQAGYGGVRTTVRATLDDAVLMLQADIGFGDVVTPAAEEIVYPVLLEDQPAPRLRAYPKYTACAEKLQALCLLGLANSRVKDYFDLWLLLQDDALDPGLLAQAIVATFQRRRSDVPDDWPVGLTDVFGNDPARETQWRAFLRKNELTAPELAVVVADLRAALAQPLDEARRQSA